MAVTPPFPALAQGLKPRPRKAPRAAAKELVFAKVLRDYARPNWQWCHIPNGELRDKRTAGKLKQMGVKAGWPDFVLVPPAGQLHCLELKRIGESLSDAQEQFKLWCVAHDVPHRMARSLDEALAALDRWNCLRIKIGSRR
jgi:hypothetical protein